MTVRVLAATVELLWPVELAVVVEFNPTRLPGKPIARETAIARATTMTMAKTKRRFPARLFPPRWCPSRGDANLIILLATRIGCADEENMNEPGC
jgi:hypothetical protein